MLIKETSAMTESEKIAVRNTNSSYLKTQCQATLAAIERHGMIYDYVGSTAPSGYAFCNGQSIAKSTHTDLFSVIGYTFGGSGDNFNLPDLRERVTVGYDNSSDTFDEIGKKVGEKNHTLTANEIPPHTHSFTAGGHDAGDAWVGAAGNSSERTGTTSSDGGGAAHNNIQPSFVCHKIIRIDDIPTADIETITTELNGKVDKVTGKGLSSNDFTNADKDKLDGIEAGAQVNEMVDQNYDPESGNAQSGIAISDVFSPAIFNTSAKGTVTITDSAEGKATAVKVYGNSTQDITPTPTNPIPIQNIGTLVTSGEHSGEYMITVYVVDNGDEPTRSQTLNVYTSEPLRIGDTLDLVSGTGTRIRALKVFNGTETITDYLTTPLAHKNDTRFVCTHSAYSFNTTPIYWANANYLAFKLNLFPEDVTSKETLKVWLAAQYEAGHPLTVEYTLPDAQQFTFTVVPVEAPTTYYPTTIIASDAETELTYKADTKHYIDNKFAALQALILEG